MFETAGKYGRRPRSQKEQRGLGAAALLAGALWVSAASAEGEPSAEETAAARVLALEGIKLADAGRCEEAIERLVRAERLHHAPVVMGRLGECQIASGRLVQGTETLRKMLREALPPSPPQVVLQARERAQELLDKTKGKIGALKIIVRGPEDTTRVSVTVDGEPMNVALLEVDRPTDPGVHVIEARAPRFSSASAQVNVGVGTRQQVVIDLAPDPHARAAEPPSAAAPALSANPDSPEIAAPTASHDLDMGGAATTATDVPREADHTLAYVAWGAAGAAAIAGSVLGLMALERKGDLSDECPGNVCPATSRDRLESARGVGTAATVSFIAAGAAAGLGTFLYFSADSESGATADANAAGSPAPARAALRARAWLGVGSVGVSGEF